MTDAEASYNQWRELLKALDAFLRDALYVAGHRHGISHYAEIPEGESPLCISKDALKEEVHGLSDLLRDLEDDIASIRETLKVYSEENGVAPFDVFKGLLVGGFAFRGVDTSDGATFEHECGYVVRLGPGAKASVIAEEVRTHKCEDFENGR